MGFSRAANVPVVIVGDIDRGGVIASIVGTKAVIDGDDAMMVRGFIVNKFRGDPALFADGMAMIAKATGWEALGLVPFFADAHRLPAEDALGLSAKGRRQGKNARIRIAVPILPHVSNFDDLDPLDAEPEVEVVKVWPGIGAAGRCRPRHPARLEVDDRRPGGAAQSRLRHRHSRASRGAAGMCSGFAAATRCSAAGCMIRTASKVRRQASTGSGCSTSRRG